VNGPNIVNSSNVVNDQIVVNCPYKWEECSKLSNCCKWSKCCDKEKNKQTNKKTPYQNTNSWFWNCSESVVWFWNCSESVVFFCLFVCFFLYHNIWIIYNSYFTGLVQVLQCKWAKCSKFHLKIHNASNNPLISILYTPIIKTNPVKLIRSIFCYFYLQYITKILIVDFRIDPKEWCFFCLFVCF
jgi:hypothetical protein